MGNDLNDDYKNIDPGEMNKYKTCKKDFNHVHIQKKDKYKYPL